MKRNQMSRAAGKGKRIKGIIIAGMVAAVIYLSFCACGETGLTGTWYSVCADPESAYDNITFQSDGTFVSDVTGEYVIEGDVARLNFLGLTTVEFEITDYDGTPALVQRGHDVPKWCKTPEAAAQAYSDAYN